MRFQTKPQYIEAIQVPFPEAIDDKGIFEDWLKNWAPDIQAKWHGEALNVRTERDDIVTVKPGEWCYINESRAFGVLSYDALRQRFEPVREI